MAGQAHGLIAVRWFSQSSRRNAGNGNRSGLDFEPLTFSLRAKASHLNTLHLDLTVYETLTPFGQNRVDPAYRELAA